jgi:hypothetical protein
MTRNTGPRLPHLIAFAERERGGWRLWLALIVALFVLNFALTFHNVWPTLWITTRHELSVELAVLVLALAVYSSLVRVPSPRAMTVLACGLMLFAIGRYAEVTAPALYGRPINLYWDAPHVLNVVTMLHVAAAPLTVALAALGIIVLLAAVLAALRFSLGAVRAALAYAPARRTLAGLATVIVGLYGIGHTAAPVRTLGWFSLPVTTTYLKQAQFTLAAYRQARDAAAPVCARAPGAAGVEALGGADVVLMFLESYGATAYERADVAAKVTRARGELAAAVEATGRGAVSAYVASPTFGGVSWLAHMTLMTGQPVRDSGSYNLLLTQDCDLLTKRFARGGYRVVGLMPGLKREWPEGAFYGFDTIYGEHALDYRGPDFGWWRIPDQYALAKVDALELGAGARRPVFLFFPTITSHMPFRPTPPYQPDWARVLGAEPYSPDAVAASLAVEPNWTDLGADYADTIAYAYETLAGFLRGHADPNLVLVVLGDHQPAASVAGEGARWDVPVHVIGTRTELLAALMRAGFVPGLTPAAEAVGPMEALGDLLLDVPAARDARDDLRGSE